MKKHLITAAALAGLAIVAVPETVLAAVPTVTTVSGVYTGGAGAYNLSGTVTAILDTYKNTNTFVLQDSTGSILAYEINSSSGSDYSPTVGDNITISSITNTVYQGSPELVNSGIGTVTLNSQHNATSPLLLTIPQFNSGGSGTSPVVPNAEALVTLDDVMIENVPNSTTTGSGQLAAKTLYPITDSSGNTADLYTYTTYSDISAAVTAANAASLTSDDTLYGGYVNITGYEDVFNGVPEIYPLSITSAGVPEPTSLGLLAVGAFGLLGRKRRTA